MGEEQNTSNEQNLNDGNTNAGTDSAPSSEHVDAQTPEFQAANEKADEKHNEVFDNQIPPSNQDAGMPENSNAANPDVTTTDWQPLNLRIPMMQGSGEAEERIPSMEGGGEAYDGPRGEIVMIGEAGEGKTKALVQVYAEDVEELRLLLRDKGFKIWGASDDEPEQVLRRAILYIDGVNHDTESESESLPTGRVLLAGTKLQLADEVVTLANDSVVNYPSDQDEQKFVGLMLHSNNLEVNRRNIKFRYNGLGIRENLRDQVDDPAHLPAFIGNLSESEANGFGVESAEWRKYRDALKA